MQYDAELHAEVPKLLKCGEIIFFFRELPFEPATIPQRGFKVLLHAGNTQHSFFSCQVALLADTGASNGVRSVLNLLVQDFVFGV